MTLAPAPATIWVYRNGDWLDVPANQVRADERFRLTPPDAVDRGRSILPSDDRGLSLPDTRNTFQLGEGS